MINRSYHFIPANKPQLFARIPQLGADAYVFDLEDAVPGESKADAVQQLRAWLNATSVEKCYYVRLNGHTSAYAGLEKSLLNEFPGLSVVLPKVESVEGLAAATEFYELEDRCVLGLMESATGLGEIDLILKSGLLTAVGLGLEDFLCESIYEGSQIPVLVQSVRSSIALAAMRFGVEAIDTISLDFSKEGEALLSDALQARSSGMTGKFSIHPNQIQKINECFGPSEALLQQALTHKDLISQASSESGYFKVGDEIFSPPKIKKLKRVLQYVNEHGN